MKIRTTYDKCPYITAGKVYEAVMRDHDYAEVVDDDGDVIGCVLRTASDHLNNIGTWEVVQE